MFWVLFAFVVKFWDRRGVKMESFSAEVDIVEKNFQINSPRIWGAESVGRQNVQFFFKFLSV